MSFTRTPRMLGELEHRVMTILWSHREPMTAGAVVREFQRTRQLAYTTILTVVNRLVAKGVLTRTPAQPHRYAPRSTPEQFFRTAAGSFLGHLRKAYGPLAIACFVTEVAQSDRKDIQRLLRQLRRSKRQGAA